MTSSTDSQQDPVMQMFSALGIELDQQTTWLDVSQDVYWLPRILPGETTSPGSTGTPLPGTGITPLARFLLALLIAGTPLAIVYIDGVQKGRQWFCLSAESGQEKSQCLVDGPPKAGSEVIPASMAPEPHSNWTWPMLERLLLGVQVLP